MLGKRWLAIALALGAACGSKKKSDEGGSGSAKPSDAAVAAIEMPALGVDAVKRMNFVYGEGADLYAKAVAAYKKGDWAAVADACGAALKKDAGHLDAHRLLGAALAQQGDGKGAAHELAIALAADWPKYGPGLAGDKDLAAFLATPDGQALAALSARIGAAWVKTEAAGPLVIGRRSTFKWPTRSGYASSRGELYALDPSGPRFFRVTHTDDQVVAWLPSPSGGELAVIGFDKVELPATPDGPALLARTWIDTLDAKTFAPTGKRTAIAKAREVDVYYAAGDQLVAVALPAADRWKTGDGVAYSIDRTTGKATKVKAPAVTGAIAKITLDEGVVDAPPAGVDGAWDGDPPAASQLTITAAKKTVTVPESGKAARAQLALSPGGQRLALVTWADPCATDGSTPSLYVFDAASGRLRHLLSNASRFAARWLDDARLIYEDGDGALHVWDDAAGQQLAFIVERGGLALRALSATPRPICKSAPPAPPAAGSGSDEPEPAPVDAGADPVSSPP